MTHYDIVVIGGGPAGMAAALGAKAAGCSSTLLIERADMLGGILNQCIHTGFGLSYFGEELTGTQYAERFRQKMHHSGIEVLLGTAVINLGTDGTLLLSGEKSGLQQIRAKAVVLATGCRERPIGTLPVTGTRPSGIFTAGMAQKLVNLGGYTIGSRFVILGSGDVGMIMARQLRLLGKEVLAVIEQHAACGGLERNRINCLEHYNIPLRTRCTIKEIHGKGRISGVTVIDLSTGLEEYLPCDTLITSIGLIPERELSEEASARSKMPDWLFLCGNACYVHDSVDDVTMESEKVGSLAALFVTHGVRAAQPDTVTTEVGKPSDTGKTICIACPKACVIKQTADGYIGAICGRKDPVIKKS